MTAQDDTARTMKPANPSRRVILAGTAAVAAGAALAPPVAAAISHAGPGADMLDRVNRWLDSLNGEQRAAATFDFDSSRRQRYNYMLGGAFAPGLPLERMTAPQKDLALDVVATGLSAEGMETAKNIMLQQDILRDEWGKGRSDRNSERFSLMIFGNPSETSPWGWRFEGHHLTMTVTLVGTEVVSHTPKSFSSEPNTVPSGPFVGLVVLPENEALGRALYADLSPANRQAATISERSVGNVTAMAGRENLTRPREGVALGDLTPGQADMARRLIDLYTTDHLSAELADAQRQRIDGNDLSAARFAWAGPNVEDESLYYRLHGDTFFIEFATLRRQPQHHHTIVHDLSRNLGRHAL
ncbi:MAG: DUF3500 domain-containing protein [Pseudomonadota bacterium]